ncbi:MAG: DNA topoisomerase I [Thermoplasmatota archaeon]
MRLIICEKNNAARRISSILSGDNVSTVKRGRVPLYQFQWEGEETYSVGLRGHILNMDFPKEYNNWSAHRPADLIEVKPEKMVSERSIASVLRSLSKEADSVYVATDYDREGELIGLEAVEYAFGENSVKTSKRARFSSLTPREITASFSDLTGIDVPLAKAAETRQIIDLYWGATLTRFVSLTSDRMGHDFLSVGRVQSPTLAIIVKKEREIRDFQPVPYWTIEGSFEKDGSGFNGVHTHGDFLEENGALEIFNRIKDAKQAEVTSVTGKERDDRPPIPFNTTHLIRAANTMGMSASRIMSVAEDLYTEGYISYPRTDNTVYPVSLDLRASTEMLAHGPYKKAADHILGKDRIIPTRGSKETTDHPPIYPTSYAAKNELSDEKWKLYDLIVRRFLATLHDPSKVRITRVNMNVGGEIFAASGVRTLYPGWREIYTFSKIKETTIPHIEKGDVISVEGIDLNAKHTKPPKRYSQGGLIQEMERLGLGTKSTRHEIIKKLYDRRYIEDSPPRPTMSGDALVTSLEKYAPHITDHDMTARLERDMEKISQGALTEEEVLDESKGMLKEIMDEMETNKVDIAKDLKEAFQIQDVVGLCPRCNHPMLLARSKWGKRYVRCSMSPGCSKSYPLPQKGKISFTENRCGDCRSPMIVMYRKGRPPFETCINPACPTKAGGKGGGGGSNDR